MFNRKSLRLGLTGALLFILVGGFTACADVNPTEVAGPQQEGTCTFVNGYWVCA